MPSSTRETGKPTSLTAWKVASSSASRLAVSRVRPDSRSSRARLGSEKRCVGGEGQVREPWQCRQLRHEFVDIASDHRFAPGEANLLHSGVDEEARNACQLLEGEQLTAIHEAVARSEYLLRHAVCATEIASIRDGYAQVAQRTSPHVNEGSAALGHARVSTDSGSFKREMVTHAPRDQGIRIA